MDKLKKEHDDMMHEIKKKNDELDLKPTSDQKKTKFIEDLQKEIAKGKYLFWMTW